MGMVGGPVIYYGRCRGGPYNTRDMAHHVNPYVVAYDPRTRKAIPGLQEPVSDAHRALVEQHHPGAAFGRYVHDPVSREWHWQGA